MLVSNFDCPQSMRCRGASLQLIVAGSKSYIPAGIFAKARFQILIEIPSPLFLVGVGFSFYSNFINPTSFKKGSERRNLPKDGEFKTQPVEKKFEVNKYSKINNLLLPAPPSHFENILLVRNIEIKIEQITSRIWQTSVLNLNCSLAHAIGCIENPISVVTNPI